MKGYYRSYKAEGQEDAQKQPHKDLVRLTADLVHCGLLVEGQGAEVHVHFRDDAEGSSNC